MSLAAQLAADAPAFLADFGESVTYTAQGQAPRTITAVVERMPLQTDPLSGRPMRGNVLELWTAAAAPAGVTAIKSGQDRVTLKVRLDDAQAREVLITKVLGDSDAGLWHVEATL
jgi:hypothetical protein